MPEPGGPGGPLAPPIFCRSVNPIQTGEGRLSPPITTGPPNVFHLPAALIKFHRWLFEADPAMAKIDAGWSELAFFLQAHI